VEKSTTKASGRSKPRQTQKKTGDKKTSRGKRTASKPETTRADEEPQKNHEILPVNDSRLESITAPEAGTPRVTRVYNELWESTTLSLSFVQHGQLDTDADTDTIALNLMDHMIQEDHWNPALSQNKLVAACFMFAGLLTGKRNSAAAIAASFEWGAQAFTSALLATAAAGKNYTDDAATRYKVARALSMRAEDVEAGYQILWEQRHALRELAGDYASNMRSLPTPRGVEEVSESADRGDAEGMEVDLIPGDGHAEGGGGGEGHGIPEPGFAYEEPVELDEFELFVRENE
jgi:hypothetical protein